MSKLISALENLYGAVQHPQVVEQVQHRDRLKVYAQDALDEARRLEMIKAEVSTGGLDLPVVETLRRQQTLIRTLRDRSNWTKDGRWSPLMGSTNKDIFLAIDEILAGDKVSEDQQRLVQEKI